MKAGFIKDKNNNKILPITHADFVIDKNGVSIQDLLTALDGYSHVWIGPTAPEDSSMLWVDTSTDGIVEDDEADIHIINNLVSQMAQMQNTIITLKKQVEWLMNNGVGPSPTESDVLLFEDGLTILLEDGTELLTETIEVVSETNAILLEDGSDILLEDNINLLLE